MAVTDQEFDELKERTKELEQSLKHIQHCIESTCRTFDAMVQHLNENGEYMIADKCMECMAHLRKHAYTDKL